MSDPFLSSDAAEIEFRVNLKKAVRSPSRREQLEAIRDYLAHQLEANLCGICLNSRLRTGDQASLVLRLDSILKEIEQLPDPNEELSEYEQLLARFDNKVGGAGASNSVEPSQLGSKRGERRQGGRRPRQAGGPDA